MAKLSPEHRRALALLAEAGPRGVPEALLIDVHGFALDTLISLLERRHVTVIPETVKAGERRMRIVRVTITDAGRRAIAA